MFSKCTILLGVTVISVISGLHKNLNDIFLHVPQLGNFRGKSEATYFTRRPIYEFLGINYAAPPSGINRFLPPQPFPRWKGTYNATKMRQRCPQMDVSLFPKMDPKDVDSREDQEDCLVVNVFTPKIHQSYSNHLLPVLFFIHGGSFFVGSAQDFYPDFLLEEDIVLVVVQYRLGPLGFISLQTEELPGNLGMLDIIAALNWVQDHIAAFGGDPTKVTIAGNSAGAGAASALLISPLITNSSRELFTQVILHSGSVLASWIINPDPVSIAKVFAEEVGCYSNDFREITDCLKKVPVEQLIDGHGNILQMSGPGSVDRLCNLVIQQAGTQRFLTENPIVSFDKGSFYHVPIIAGTTRDEGSSFLADFYMMVGDRPPAYYKRNITQDLLKILGIQEKAIGIIDIFHNKYFANVGDFASASAALMDLIGAQFFKGPTTHVARRMSQYRPSYLYSFNFEGFSKMILSDPMWNQKYPFPPGVAHSDDLQYLFPLPDHKYTKKELRMVRTMVNLWTKFIIQGKPAPTPEVSIWEPMSHEFGPYLRIQETPTMRDNIFDEFETNFRDGFARNLAGKFSAPSFGIIFIACYLLLSYY